MAKLTVRQAEMQVEREKEKQKALKKKQDIQKVKETLGEDWRKVLHDGLQKQVETEIGSDIAPKLYNSKDLYDLFDPIIIYRDAENLELQMDYENFANTETKYREAIEKLDKELLEKEKESKKKIKVSPLITDGTNETDNILPGAEDEFEEEIEEEVEVEEGEGENKTVTKQIIKKKNPISLAKEKLNKIVSLYFNRFVPVYNKYVCDCCGVSKRLSDYYIIYSITNSGRIDDKGNRYMSICKSCANKLFIYYYTQVTNKDMEKAMMNTCASLNLYWDANILMQAKDDYEASNRKGSLLGSYIARLNKTAPGLTFVDSPFLTDENYEAHIVQDRYAAPLDWNEQDAKNKKDIIHILGYDPFEYENNEEDKKILYADLVSIIDEDIQQDYVKLQSALTIVKSFTKVRKLDEKAHDMEIHNAPLNEQKSIADLKAKELKAISDFSRDSGFSERFKTRQSQGSTSFTGIMKTMNEKKFEDELINKYDIATSSTIQAAADASFKAIFTQLNLSEAEAYKIAAEQLEELRKVKKENEKLQEDLRQAKYQIAENQLREKAREKGVEIND